MFSFLGKLSCHKFSSILVVKKKPTIITSKYTEELIVRWSGFDSAIGFE